MPVPAPQANAAATPTALSVVPANPMVKPDVVRDQVLQHTRAYACALTDILTWRAQYPGEASRKEALINAEAKLVHSILGLMPTPAPTVDPNEDTQLIDTTKVAKPKELSPRDMSLQRLFDELLVRHERIYQAIVKYLGGEPKTIQLRTADLLNSVIDLSEIMIAYGGDCADLVRAIREDEAARRVNTKRQVRSQENEAKPLMAKTLTPAAAEALGNPVSVLTEPAARSTPGYPAPVFVVDGDRTTPGYPAGVVVAEGDRTTPGYQAPVVTKEGCIVTKSGALESVTPSTTDCFGNVTPKEGASLDDDKHPATIPESPQG